jgi:hypothetical protein
MKCSYIHFSVLYEKEVKQSLMKYVCQKLEPFLAVSIESTNNKYIYHQIKPLFSLKI